MKVVRKLQFVDPPSLRQSVSIGSERPNFGLARSQGLRVLFQSNARRQFFLLQRAAHVETIHALGGHQAGTFHGGFQAAESDLPIERHFPQIGPPLGEDQLERGFGLDAEHVTRVGFAGDVYKFFKFERPFRKSGKSIQFIGSLFVTISESVDSNLVFFVTEE